ncbi:hypothetical protein Lnau_0692 [Legionella nautarum]|uniref:Uncharacterized protein n=1 Tax=Legionella nautarum TaxID=45070 RepID=A0A0W0WTR7_9GAMM|nr:hypothetical protein [Legionella nautarum]KTD35708.1 hypothetical protein Lnau_0692 [Legionella nautarum]
MKSKASYSTLSPPTTPPPKKSVYAHNPYIALPEKNAAKNNKADEAEVKPNSNPNTSN